MQQLPDGGRVLEVIGSPNAPTEFSYDIDVPAGMEIIEHDDGSLLIGTEQQVGNTVTVEVDGVIGPEAAGRVRRVRQMSMNVGVYRGGFCS